MKPIGSGFNMAKIETLELVNHYGSLTSTMLSEIASITLQNASTRLRRYYRQGSLERIRVDRTYVYALSPSGLDKLGYFQSSPKCRPVYSSLLSLYGGLRCRVPSREIDLVGECDGLTGGYVSEVVDQAIFEMFSVPDLSEPLHEKSSYDTYVELDEAEVQRRLYLIQHKRQRFYPLDWEQ